MNLVLFGAAKFGLSAPIGSEIWGHLAGTLQFYGHELLFYLIDKYIMYYI